MFKIVCNTEHWHNLYVSRHASNILRSFEVREEDSKLFYGATRVLSREGYSIRMERLCLSPRGDRPRLVVLVTEPPQHLELGTRILFGLQRELEAVNRADRLADARDESLTITKYCEAIDALSPGQAPGVEADEPQPRTKPKGIWIGIACAGVGLGLLALALSAASFSRGKLSGTDVVKALQSDLDAKNVMQQQMVRPEMERVVSNSIQAFLETTHSRSRGIESSSVLGYIVSGRPNVGVQGTLSLLPGYSVRKVTLIIQSIGGLRNSDTLGFVRFEFNKPIDSKSLIKRLETKGSSDQPQILGRVELSSPQDISSVSIQLLDSDRAEFQLGEAGLLLVTCLKSL